MKGDGSDPEIAGILIGNANTVSFGGVWPVTILEAKISRLPDLNSNANSKSVSAPTRMLEPL